MAQLQHGSKTRLLEATLSVVRAKGYSAMRIEDVCAEAGLTKGSFFHHFKSKDDLALAAADLWNDHVRDAFAAAAYRADENAVDRLLGYVALRKELLVGHIAGYACFAGTIIQEVHETHPHLRAACAVSIEAHIADLETMVAEAIRQRRVQPDWDAESLAVHIQSVVQGALILAKSRQDPAPAIASLDHLHRYLAGLFGVAPKKTSLREKPSAGRSRKPNPLRKKEHDS